MQLTKENSRIPATRNRIEDEIVRLTQLRNSIDESIKNLEQTLDYLKDE